MSITPFSNQEKVPKKLFHRWNDSGELDVFEAARYFSANNEAITQRVPQSTLVKDDRRMSLDVPMKHMLIIPSQSHGVVDKQITKDHKKCKQPSSPGGRLASFLNSLFNQNSTKKNKSIKSLSKSMKDHEDDHNPTFGRRKRRSSMSHFTISSTSTTTNDSKSFYSSSSSGFKNTPSKTYMDLRSFSDKKQASTFSEENAGQVIKSIILDEKFEFKNDFFEKNRKLLGNEEKPEKDMIWVDRYPSEEKEFRVFKRGEVDDGAESDSSSDLFELQNYNLGSSGNLPVYETTNMENIKRGSPVSNGIH